MRALKFHGMSKQSLRTIKSWFLLCPCVWDWSVIQWLGYSVIDKFLLQSLNQRSAKCGTVQHLWLRLGENAITYVMPSRVAELFVLDKLKFISTCGGLTLARCQVPTKSHYYSPAGQRRENKMKNHSWVEIRQFAKAKVKVFMCTAKEKENVYSRFLVSKWCSGHFQWSDCSGK